MHPADLDAGQPSSVGIVADRVDMSSPRRVSQDVGEHGVQRQHHDHAGGDPEPPSVDRRAEPFQLRRSSVLRTVRPVAYSRRE